MQFLSSQVTGVLTARHLLPVTYLLVRRLTKAAESMTTDYIKDRASKNPKAFYITNQATSNNDKNVPRDAVDFLADDLGISEEIMDGVKTDVTSKDTLHQQPDWKSFRINKEYDLKKKMESINEIFANQRGTYAETNYFQDSLFDDDFDRDDKDIDGDIKRKSRERIGRLMLDLEKEYDDYADIDGYYDEYFCDFYPKER